MSIFLPHVSHVGNGGAHPIVQDVFVMDVRLVRARLASPEVWQHLLAEMPQHACLLGVHDGREGWSVSKIWTSLTARVKTKRETERSQSLCTAMTVCNS